MKKKFFGLALIVMLSFALALPSAYAASAKATVKVGNLAEVTATTADVLSEDGWVTVLENQIKTSSQKDLFVDVSMECGLTTNTKVMSKKLERAVSNAEAAVYVRVLVDGVVQKPEYVTFAKRKQTLIAEFAGDILNCLDEEGHVIVDTNDECILEESVALILDTLSAHSFNFIAEDVGVGLHKVTVQAKTAYNAELQELGIDDIEFPGTTAWVGKGSMTVDEVRLIQDEDVQIPEI
jgi:hypothetical protein